MNGDAPERSDLVRLAAIVETLLGAAERVEGELVSDTLIAELYELRERVHAALQP